MVCPLARHARLPCNNSTSRTCKIFHLLHIDVWGPYNVRTFDGNKMFLQIVDDHSRITCLYLLKLKSDVIVVLRNFFKMGQTQFRTDSGGEFVNTSCSHLFQSLGLVHQRTCVHTPHQNGVAETKRKHILEIAAVRFQGDIPLKFWGYCVIVAVYSINRIPSVALQGKSPYEVLHRRKPNLQHLKVMGCLCFAKKLNNHDKFATRALADIMMGYSESTIGYKI